jgi:hypothetical protein
MTIASEIHAPARATGKSEVPVWRLYLLRLLYAAIAFLMGSMIWPIVVQHGQLRMMHSVALAMLAALSATAVLGIRYPLQMLPLLFFEMAWKVIWLAAFALPEAMKGPLSADYMQTAFDTSIVVIVPLIIPWRYAIETYVKRRGDRWW